MTLVFPGLFGKGRTLSQLNGNDLDGDGEVHPHVIYSNDRRQFSQNFSYVFEDVESVDEDQRQRRRIQSAGNQLDPLQASEEHISTLINSVMSTPRDFFFNDTVRASVVRYLTDKMRNFGLVTGNQMFDPQEFYAVFDGHVPNGTNVIGILPGELWGTKEDEILIIGAHWDTYPLSNGMDDNGSGVTALMEVARALTEGSCRPRNSIIFVAFDLEEAGCIGSIYFLRNFLIPNVLAVHGAKVKGAFILDTIMNFNDTQFSQTLSQEWKDALPEFWTQLQAENRTGDFLTAMYRKDVDFVLAKSFADHWPNDDVSHVSPTPPKPTRFRKSQKDNDDVKVETIGGKYRLKKVRLDMDAQVEKLDLLIPWLDLLRSDHARFWYHNLDYPTSFPAVLITDTGPYRGVMQECYHKPCDSSSENTQLKFADVKFLRQTCQALIDSVISLSQSSCFVRSFNAHSGSTLNGNASVHNKSISPALLATLLIALLGSVALAKHH